MELFFEEEGQSALPLKCELLAAQIIEAVLDFEGCPYEAEVTLLLTDDESIRQLNMRFRNMNQATDVLSFPMINFDGFRSFAWLKDADEYFNPETGRLLLGDIVISKEKVIAQAKEYGHTLKREYAFLIVHSVLHLLGYDHMTSGERKVMEERQRAILEGLAILR